MSVLVARLVALVLAIAVVQEVVMARVEIFGVHPDLLLGFAVVVAIVGGANRGALAGLFAGVLTDSLTGTAIGTATIAYTATAFAVGTVSDDTADYSWVIAMTTMVASAGAVIVYVIVGAVLGDFSVGVRHTIAVAVVVALVNAMFAPLVARVLRDIWKKQSQLAW